jgi:hypothetical protein
MAKAIEVNSCLECLIERNKPCDMDAAMVFFGTDYKNPIHPRCPLPNKMELPSKEEINKIIDDFCCKNDWEGKDKRLVSLGFDKAIERLKPKDGDRGTYEM